MKIRNIINKINILTIYLMAFWTVHMPARFEMQAELQFSGRLLHA